MMLTDTARPGRPKNTARKAELAAATWSVIAREGLGGATVRRIATELGTTTGVVMHYFQDKDALIRFAFDRIFQLLDERVEKATVGREGLDWIRAFFDASLPTDEELIQHWQVWIAFLGQMKNHPHSVESQRARYDELEQIFSQNLELAVGHGDLPASTDVTLEAKTLLALVDGIGVGHFIDSTRYDVPTQRAIASQHLRRLTRL